MWKLQLLGVVAFLLAFSRADTVSDDTKEIKSLDEALNELIQQAEGASVKTSDTDGATEAKQDTLSDPEIDQEKDEQKTAEDSSEPADDDITDPDPVEDSKMDPEEIPDLEEDDLELISDVVANDAYSSRAKTIILCEGARGRLHCPSGTTIYITAANYGRTTGRSVCPHRSIRTTRCWARSSLWKVRRACQNKANCALYSSNSVFGDPCRGTYKYLQVSFRCRRAAPPPECRFGGRFGYRWLNDRDRASAHILRGAAKCDRSLATAWYRFGGLAGRDMPTSPIPTNRCQTHASGWFQGRLPVRRYQKTSGKVCFHWSGNRCRWNTRISVTNCGLYRVYRLQRTPACSLRYCGNRKHVIPSPIITKRVCEGRSETLRCPGRKRIRVVYANYGRLTGRSVCPSKWMKTTRCISSYSSKLLRCACHGQSRCYLHANNVVFGDPCVGTYKYIEIRYRCI